MVCGVGGMDVKLSKEKMKMCTSCEQKVICNDGSPNTLNSNNADNINVVSAGLDNMKVSNDVDDDATAGISGTSCDIISDDKLFQDPPPKPECPICMLPIPFADEVRRLCDVVRIIQPCCGKVICGGCVEASDQEMDKGNMKDLCPLCRVTNPRKDKEKLKMLKERMKLNDCEAYLQLGNVYYGGLMGLPKDMSKAVKFYQKAADLGSIDAHFDIGAAYYSGQGVDKDVLKAIHYFEIAAIGGHEVARHNLGVIEKAIGRMDRAMKHFMIAAKSGYDKCLKEIGTGYKSGHVTKDDYTKALRAYQVSVNEMKSDQRTKAAEIHALRKGFTSMKSIRSIG